MIKTYIIKSCNNEKAYHLNMNKVMTRMHTHTHKHLHDFVTAGPISMHASLS